jgi:hypothetical protein
VSVDRIVDVFNYEWSTDSESVDGVDTYWWWARDVRVDPSEIIASDGEGGTWRVPYETDGEYTVSFGQPVQVRETYVDITTPAAASSAAAARVGQRVLASNLERPEKAAPGSDNAAAAAEQEENSMTPEQIRLLRGRLGLTEDQLPDDASPEQVTAVLSAAPEPPEPTPEADAEPEPTAPGEETEAAPEPLLAAASVDPQALADLQADAKAGREARAQQLREQRAAIVDTAVRKGKFPPSARASYLAQLKKGGEIEAATRAFIDGLAEGVVPVKELGTAASAETDVSGAEKTTGWFPKLASKEA